MYLRPRSAIVVEGHIKQPTISEEQRAMLRNLFADEEGQGLVEYALILVLIAIVATGILTVLGNTV